MNRPVSGGLGAGGSPGSVGRPGLGNLRPQPGVATRPAPAPGLSRPVPQTRPGGIGGPGIGGPGIGGGDRPNIGGPQRPTTLPGDLTGNRPGIGGGNRPGIGGGNRPGIGGGRPGIGDGNNFWNNGSIGSNNWIHGNNNFTNVNVGGGWGLPGYGWGGGYGGWANNWNNGFVNPRYGGWYNGCWGGNWGYGGGWWAPFAVGAATWGLASSLGTWGWGYGSVGYANPYYSAIPAAVVAASPSDYSQPVIVNNYITNDGDLTDASTIQGGSGTGGSVTSSASPTADAAFDSALAAFKKGDYAAALAGCDKAIAVSPNDSVIHEVRALALFALGRYPEAAATLNAVLAVAPGMDWTTMSSLYDSVDTYTQQLRTLEDFCRANPGSAAGSFVLAYHYLVGGHVEMAADVLRVVVEKQPTDVVAKRLLDAIAPPDQQQQQQAGQLPAPQPKPAAEAAATPAGPETDLVGTWTATSGTDSVELAITADSAFTWKATPAGRPAVEISGTIETARDAIALVSQTAGTMTAQVVSKGADAFEFRLVGAPPDAPPLSFQRRK